MQIRILQGIEGARKATGTVVVIDVLRAFTTAAYAFAAGIAEIQLVSTVEEAFRVEGFRMGEVGGRLIPGFDHNNSPSQLIGRKLSGRAVQRTGSGTRCVVAASGAVEVWLGSLVVASATARALADRAEVTLVASGYPEEGEEDLACAEMLVALLQGTPVHQERIVAAVQNSRAAHKHRLGDTDSPLEDIACAVSIDAFSFAMKVENRTGGLIAKPVVR
ncbi:MAG: 2-phosphosulfolactate phosphatase [Planctomycetaceae bacterium]|nr:2-phosphosulfolactate phosphatase [Planctomycetaceae bacterium]